MKRVYKYDGIEVEISGPADILNRVSESIAGAINFKNWKPMSVYTETTHDEIQSKFKKVTMKEDGEIVIEGAKPLTLNDHDKAIYSSEKPFHYQVCPSCNGYVAFANFVWCDKCKNKGLIPEAPKEIEKTFINPPERDWEVIEFKGKNGSGSYYLGSDGLYFNMDSLTNVRYKGESFLTGQYSNTNFIQSVRRKSDNSIWTVGQQTNFGQIGAFQLSKDNLHMNVHFADPGDAVFIGHLKHPMPAKQPLFTTNDGVEIYEGMPYFVVCMNFDIASHTAGTVKPNDDFISRTFHDKAKANEYVEYNKPVELIFSYAGITYEIKAKNKPQADCFEGIILNPPKSGFGPHITVKK